MFSENLREFNFRESFTENINDESSQSETKWIVKVFKGFSERASKDPEALELKRKLEFYKERNGTTLGFFFSFSVPRKKRSMINAQTDKGTDSSKQDIRSSKWIQLVPYDMGSSSYQGSLDKDENKQEQRKEQKRKISSKKKMIIVPVPRQPILKVEVEPRMPERLRGIVEEKNGSNITFVIQKALTSTDLAQQNNRLSLPRKQVKTDSFLTDEEKEILDARTNNGIKVELITPCGNLMELTLKKWRMNSTSVYNIIGAWFKLVVEDRNNRLELGKIVRLWSFRTTSKLGFVLDCD